MSGIIEHWSGNKLAEGLIGDQSRRDFLKRMGVAGGVILGSGLWAPRRVEAGSVIKQRTISSATETAIQMNNSRWARSVTFPSGWTQIRVGLRLHLVNSGANLASSPNLFLGFSSGTSAVAGDATPTHVVGFRTNYATWTWNSGNGVAGNYQVFTTTPTNFGVNVSGTWTNFNSGSNKVMYLAAGAGAAAADREILLCDMIRSDTSGGSATYTFKEFVKNASNTGTDASSSDFLAQMALATPSLSNYAYGNGATQTINQTGNGTFNAINVWWDRADALLEVCDVAFARLA